MKDLNNLNEGKYIYHISWFPDVKINKTKGLTLNADCHDEAVAKWKNIKEFRDIVADGGELPEPFEPHYIINKSL